MEKFLDDIKLIKESYNKLKQKLARIPRLKDFDLYDSIDAIKIFNNGTLGAYYKLITK